MKTDYEKQALDFARKNGIKLTFIGDPEYKIYFDDDKEYRYVFKCKLSRNGKSYTFSFGQSIANDSKEPTIYDVLACLTKYDPEDFRSFCREFGYNDDSMKAFKTYKAVVKEWNNVNRLFSDILEGLQEIQ